MSEPNSERIITPMPPSLVQLIDDYRFKNRVASRRSNPPVDPEWRPPRNDLAGRIAPIAGSPEYVVRVVEADLVGIKKGTRIEMLLYPGIGVLYVLSSTRTLTRVKRHTRCLPAS
jgi:hypothetical protein